jgi:hypothetical protein
VRQFFAGLGGSGLMWNALGAAGVLCALGVALVAGAAFGVSPAHTLGLFAGAMTSRSMSRQTISLVARLPITSIGPIDASAAARSSAALMMDLGSRLTMGLSSSGGLQLIRDLGSREGSPADGRRAPVGTESS